MKLFVVLALIAAIAAAAPQARGPAGPDADAQIVRSESDVQPEEYKYVYETSNGISAQEEGQLQNAGSEDEAIAVRGQYSYPGPDGVIYTVTYIADKGGFQPQGAHLPVGPQ